MIEQRRKENRVMSEKTKKQSRRAAPGRNMKPKRRSYERTEHDPIALTPIEHNGLQEAYDHFNATLFEGALPDVFITYQRRAHSAGYFSPDCFSGRVGDFGRHELALNPDGFIGHTDEQIVQTLVHEMTHVLLASLRNAVDARLSQSGMGRQDEGDRSAAVVNRDGRRQGDRPTNVGLHHLGWPVRPILRAAGSDGMGPQSAIGRASRIADRDQAQDQVHVSALWPECLGQARPRDRLQTCGADMPVAS
jgi:hypothetical protein